MKKTSASWSSASPAIATASTMCPWAPVFSDLAVPRPLKLMSSKAFPAGSVAQIYRPA
jgi:hypothetical protein